MIDKMRLLISDALRELLVSTGLLVLRVGTGLMMLTAHGWGKLTRIFEGRLGDFADPIGVGPTLSHLLAIFAEVICAALIVVGLGTRLAAIPLLITMLVAAFIVHADDPWQKKEFALLYAIPCLVIAITGPGRFSLDSLILFGRRFVPARTAPPPPPTRV